jgi:hypothetical protein
VTLRARTFVGAAWAAGGWSTRSPATASATEASTASARLRFAAEMLLAVRLLVVDH